MFGTYEQDNNFTNGKEKIEWIVLDKKDGKALIISKYVLDCQPYNTQNNKVTWETCTLRNWLNTTFYTSAFKTNQQSMIATTTLKNEDNPSYGTEGGSSTADKIFLLSIEEAQLYFSGNSKRKTVGTPYAADQSSYSSNWWLRSPGDYTNFAAIVNIDGSVNYFGHRVNHGTYAVRPALWINLES